jgi:hypothetical protein
MRSESVEPPVPQRQSRPPVQAQPPVPVRSRQERLAGTPTAPPPQPVAHVPESRGGDAPVQRTKNGLVKRNRNRPEEPAARPAAGSRPPTAVEKRSPEEVRSMLSSFRTGHQRGERGPLPARVNTVPEEEPR